MDITKATDNNELGALEPTGNDCLAIIEVDQSQATTPQSNPDVQKVKEIFQVPTIIKQPDDADYQELFYAVMELYKTELDNTKLDNTKLDNTKLDNTKLNQFKKDIINYRQAREIYQSIYSCTEYSSASGRHNGKVVISRTNEIKDIAKTVKGAIKINNIFKESPNISSFLEKLIPMTYMSQYDTHIISSNNKYGYWLLGLEMATSYTFLKSIICCEYISSKSTLEGVLSKLYNFTEILVEKVKKLPVEAIWFHDITNEQFKCINKMKSICSNIPNIHILLELHKKNIDYNSLLNQFLDEWKIGASSDNPTATKFVDLVYWLIKNDLTDIKKFTQAKLINSNECQSVQDYIDSLIIKLKERYHSRSENYSDAIATTSTDVHT